MKKLLLLLFFIPQIVLGQYSINEDSIRQKAKELKNKSDILIDFIQEMKYNLVLTVDNAVFLGEHLDEDGEEIEENKYEVSYEKLDDIDKNKKIAFLNNKNDRNSSNQLVSSGNATKLKSMIEDYKTDLLILSNMDKNMIKEILSSLNTDNIDKESWERYNFYDMPAVGVLTLLSKWQADVKNIEAEVISQIVDMLKENGVNKLKLKDYYGDEIFTQPNLINLIDAEYNSIMGSNFPYFGAIGSSKEGLFAYQISYCDPEGCFNSIEVFSSKTDELIDVLYFDNNNHDIDLEEEWNINYKKIHELLSRYNIYNTGFGEFYRSNRIDNFEIKLKRNIIDCDEPDYGWTYGAESEIHYKILLGNDNLGYKKVTSGVQDCGVIGLSFEGYFIDPFEDRILIVLSSYSLGFEAEEDYNLHFFGCSLKTSSFK